jgi:hypothetical protein
MCKIKSYLLNDILANISQTNSELNKLLVNIEDEKIGISESAIAILNSFDLFENDPDFKYFPDRKLAKEYTLKYLADIFESHNTAVIEFYYKKQLRDLSIISRKLGKWYLIANKDVKYTNNLLVGSMYFVPSAINEAEIILGVSLNNDELIKTCLYSPVLRGFVKKVIKKLKGNILATKFYFSNESIILAEIYLPNKPIYVLLTSCMF